MSMEKNAPAERRELKLERLDTDLAVIGGGLAGVCAAITAARAGQKVVLVQDRPVLGGNASSEVRLWVLGATSHMGNNNRWAREGGVIDELLVENMYRNPEGNPVLFDALVLEWVVREPNVTLLLNTAVYDLQKSAPDTIRSVRAFCSQNSTAYEITAPLFVDASGDGIVGFLAGAAFRVGAEARSEFDEPFAPEQASRQLLGHTLYFYSKDAGRPVRFVPPAFALRDITRIPRWRNIRFNDSGCMLWWLEWGGQLDTIHDSERIKWELWRVAYGVWDFIKNSGQFPEAETLTLEWVGAIPGKRESRRFEGDYMLSQRDLIEQRPHPDVVSYGGWAIDLHPADGVYSAQPACQQWHAKGVYPIPYRCLYSRNLTNLFLAGRLISASHIAFASTRVMGTCAHNAQAVGMAAALCLRHRLKPRDLVAGPRMAELQRELLRTGHYIPGVALDDPEDLARRARVTASSELKLSRLEPGGEVQLLECSQAMLLPVPAGPVPTFEFLLDVLETTRLRAELRASSKPQNHTPDVTLAVLEKTLAKGPNQALSLQFNATIDTPRYVFVCLMANPHIGVHLSDQRVTGVLALAQRFNGAVAKSARQEPPPGSGLESFEFWLPQRRPAGKNLALVIDPPLAVFGAANLTNGLLRPTNQPNAWVAEFGHPQPGVQLAWEHPQTLARIELCFDVDFDHPMESVLMGHPERIVPFCVQEVVIMAADERAENNPDRKRLVARISGNHHARQVIHLNPPVTTDCLEIRPAAPAPNIPAALFAVRCYPAT